MLLLGFPTLKTFDNAFVEQASRCYESLTITVDVFSECFEQRCVWFRRQIVTREALTDHAPSVTAAAEGALDASIS